MQQRLAVGFGGMREVAIRVIALARLEPGAGRVSEPHGDAAESAVLVVVGAGEAEDVVRRDVFHDLGERLAEVVGIGKRRAAGVGRERGERLLLRRELRELIRHASTRERADAAPASLPRAAAGHDGLQPARIDGIDRDVGAHGRVHRCPELDLIVRAAALHPRAEVDDGLLLLNRLQGLGQRFERAQADVVVERIELLRAGIDRRAVVRRRVVGLVGSRGAGIDRRERRPLGGRERCQHGVHLLLAAREVAEDLQARSNRSHRHQVRRGHLLVHPLQSRIGGLLHVLRLHRAGVEHQREQPVPRNIFRRQGHRDVAVGRWCRGWRRPGGRRVRGGRWGGR